MKKGIPAAQSRDSDTSRARIISFLRQLYESVAETLPDVRDDSYEFDNASVVLDIPELSDPYAEAMSQKSQDIKPMADSSVRGGKRKIRKKKRSVVISSERKAEEDRYLPPGQMRDYWEQFKAAEGSDSGKVPVFSTFWRVWLQEFSFLKFRAQSSHSMCSTCVRHRFLIREMSGHLRAREEQQSLYTLHLRKQYFDRVCYWELRGLSRLRSFDAVLILDGMDQAKFAYPRSDFFRTKELAGVQRPRAHISACILHGRSVIFTVSPSNLAKDANSCIETTAFALSLLSKHVDLSRITLHVQSDNTVREVKNNFFIRWMSSLVAHGFLAFDTESVLYAMRSQTP